jgi:hypothetical protein
MFKLKCMFKYTLARGEGARGMGYLIWISAAGRFG